MTHMGNSSDLLKISREEIEEIRASADSSSLRSDMRKIVDNRLDRVPAGGDVDSYIEFLENMQSLFADDAPQNISPMKIDDNLIIL